MVTRREFIDTLATGATGLAITSSARSYSQILGSNERLNFAVIGLNSRAYAHLSALHSNKDAARIAHVCDRHHRANFSPHACRDQGRFRVVPQT